MVLTAVKDAGALKVVLLLRLGPIPYSITNYAASLSPDIGVLKYWIGSMVSAEALLWQVPPCSRVSNHQAVLT